MSDERQEAREQLLAIIKGYMDRGEPIILERLGLRTDVKALLFLARTKSECVEFAHHRLLQSLVQGFRLSNRYRSRALGALPAALFSTTDLLLHTAGRPTHLYASASAIEANPAFRKVAMLGSLKFVCGVVQGMGYLGDETIERLVTGIGEVFEHVLEAA